MGYDIAHRTKALSIIEDWLFFMTTYGFGISFHNSHTVIILIFDIVHILLKWFFTPVEGKQILVYDFIYVQT